MAGRKKAEKPLSKSAERYRKLIVEMCNGFALNEIICDRNGVPRDCRFLEVNPAFEKIAGMKATDIVGKSAEAVFPGTESFWVTQCGEIATGGSPVQFKNGSKMFDRYFEVIAFSPQRGQVATIFTDVTRWIQTEEALRESENNFRAIAENAYDGILVLNEQATYVFANRRATEISGYSSDELLAMSFEDLNHPDEVERVSKIFNRRITGKLVPRTYETKIVTKQGDILPIEVSGSKTFWRGQPAAIVVFRDITNRKKLEQTMVNAKSELERQVAERTSDLKEIDEELNQKQKELLHHKQELEKANKELVRVNTALSVLARNIDRKKREVESRIARTISLRIMPILAEIRSEKIPEKTRAQLDVLDACLTDLVSQTSRNHEIIVSLSASELRIAMMIKNGLSTEAIARLLHVSPHTVKTHRKNIRKKLDIQNASINLSSYLRLKLGKKSAKS